jgi:hypothetical protein
MIVLHFKKVKAGIIGLSMLMSSLSLPMSIAPLQASAASVSLKIATSRVVSNSGVPSGVKVGDLKVNVKLSSSQNVTSCAAYVQIGNGLSNLNTDQSPVLTSALANKYTDVGTSKTFSFVGVGDLDSNGELVDVKTDTLFTFYVRKNTSLTSSNGTIRVSIDTLSNSSGDIELSNIVVGDRDDLISATSSTSYKLGDVNNDGKVNSSDSVIVLGALKNHNLSNSKISVYSVANNLSSWFPKAKAAEAADVNQDLYISSADSDSILDYYAKSIVNTYSGNIGNTYYTVKSIT